MTTASTATPSALQQQHQQTLCERKWSIIINPHLQKSAAAARWYRMEKKTTFMRLSAKTTLLELLNVPIRTQKSRTRRRSNCANSHGGPRSRLFQFPRLPYTNPKPMTDIDTESRAEPEINHHASVCVDVPCLHTSTRRPKRLTGLQRNGSSRNSSCIYGECPSRNL